MAFTAESPLAQGQYSRKLVRVTGATFASPWTNCYCAPLFSHTHYWYKVSKFKYEILFVLLLPLYCFMDTFSPSDLCLYKYNKESS